MYRLPANSSEVLSKFARLPSHPLSYEEARELVRRAYGKDLNDAGTRAAINMTAPTNPNITVRLLSNSKVEGDGANLHNIILTIRGEIEPGIRVYPYTLHCTVYEYEYSY